MPASPDQFQPVLTSSDPVPTSPDQSRPVPTGPDQSRPVPTNPDQSRPAPTSLDKSRPVRRPQRAAGPCLGWECLSLFFPQFPTYSIGTGRQLWERDLSIPSPEHFWSGLVRMVEIVGERNLSQAGFWRNLSRDWSGQVGTGRACRKRRITHSAQTAPRRSEPF